MVRLASPRTALYAGLLLACASFGCDPASGAPPEPPRPAGLAAFDPDVVLRIQEALAKLDPDRTSSAAWAELGFVYASERLKDLGLECFREASRLDPRQPRWPYREAVLQAQTGSFEEAVKAIRRSIEIEPGYAPSHSRLGEYHLALGDLDQAEAAFREATRLDSSYPGGWIGLARVSLQRDRVGAAIEILERLLREDPEDRLVRQLLETARRQDGQAGASAEALTLDDEGLPVWNDPWELEARAYRRKPDMLQVGRLLREGHAAEALTLLEEERARGGDPFDTALSVAAALRQLGRNDEAAREVKALLAHDPENTQALLLEVDMLDDGGDVPGAVALLERVNELQPTFGGAFAARATKLAALGRHEEALTAFQRALELGVHDFSLSYGLGASLIALKRWSEAAALFERLVAEQPEHGDAWLELAIARLRGGSPEGAQQAVARAKATGQATPRLLDNVEKSLVGALERRRKKDGESAADPEDEPR